MNILINREKEGLNILFIKIHLESNSKTPGVESTIANLFYFLHFEEVVGVDFVGLLSKDGFRETIRDAES